MNGDGWIRDLMLKLGEPERAAGSARQAELHRKAVERRKKQKKNNKRSKK